MEASASASYTDTGCTVVRPCSDSPSPRSSLHLKECEKGSENVQREVADECEEEVGQVAHGQVDRGRG